MKTVAIEGCQAFRGIFCGHCGGGWPGTRATTEQLTRAFEAGRLNPDKLGCAPLQDRARKALTEIQGNNSRVIVFQPKK